MQKTIEYLLRNSSSFDVVIFQEFLMKIGQISVNSILSLGKFTTDIEYHRDKIFAVLMKPLLEICDCTIRIKNFEDYDFVPIFILKDSVCETLQTVYQQKRELFKGETIITSEAIQEYRKEISQNNIKQISKFVHSNFKKSDVEIAEEIVINLKNTSPYLKVGIKLDLFNILRILLPNLSNFLQTLIKETKIKIKETIKHQEQSLQSLKKLFIENKLFWDSTTNSLPTVFSIGDKLKELAIDKNISISDKQIINFLRGTTLFAIIEVEKKQKKEELIKNLINTTYKIKRDINGEIVVYENDKLIKIISSNKIQIIKNLIREFVLNEIVITINPTLGLDSINKDAFVLFINNIKEIVRFSIANKNRVQLKALLEFLKLNDNKQLYSQYGKFIINTIVLIEEYTVKKSELNFLEGHSRKLNFLFKILNNLFSQWSYKSVEKRVVTLKQNINREVNTIYKILKKDNDQSDNIQPNYNQDYSPVKSALNFIKNNYNKIDLQNIVNSKEPNINKIEQIFSIYSEIGNTNKAIIYKNEKLQSEFLQGLRILIKN